MQGSKRIKFANEVKEGFLLFSRFVASCNNLFYLHLSFIAKLLLRLILQANLVRKLCSVGSYDFHGIGKTTLSLKVIKAP